MATLRPISMHQLRSRKPGEPAGEPGMEGDDLLTTRTRGYARYFVPPPIQYTWPGITSPGLSGTTNAPNSLNDNPTRVEHSNYYDIGVGRQFTPAWQVTADGFYKGDKPVIDSGQFGSALSPRPVQAMRSAINTEPRSAAPSNKAACRCSATSPGSSPRVATSSPTSISSSTTPPGLHQTALHRPGSRRILHGFRRSFLRVEKQPGLRRRTVRLGIAKRLCQYQQAAPVRPGKRWL